MRYAFEKMKLFVMSESEIVKNTYFATTILSSQYMKDIYLELLKQKSNKEANNIIKNFSLISLLERNDIKLTNSYFLPIWKLIKDDNKNEKYNDFEIIINSILTQDNN